MQLADIDRALLDGQEGAGPAFAMRILLRFGEALGADGFIDITRAHVDGCLYHGRASLDFVEHLVRLGARVRVPTTLNVGSMDLLHPELYRGPTETATAARRLMEAHLELGCAPTFTCAPYQTIHRPAFGEQIAWAESNAIVFANSVIGARTARYGDFVDLCAALTGRVPDAGLHRPENRHARIVFEIDAAADGTATTAVAAGLIAGIRSGRLVPAIMGLPPETDEDDLKALGAAAASSGAVGMFHAVGLTPEAPTLDAALGGREPEKTVRLSKADLAAALAQLSTVPDGVPIRAVALGTPHFSLAEFGRLMPLLDGFVPAPGLDLYVNCARDAFDELDRRGWRTRLEAAGFTLVVDTCTYVTSVMRSLDGVVVTNSGKWAHYAPGNLGVDVAFAPLVDCLASAAAGRLVRGGP